MSRSSSCSLHAGIGEVSKGNYDHRDRVPKRRYLFLFDISISAVRPALSQPTGKFSSKLSLVRPSRRFGAARCGQGIPPRYNVRLRANRKTIMNGATNRTATTGRSNRPATETAKANIQNRERSGSASGARKPHAPATRTCRRCTLPARAWSPKRWSIVAAAREALARAGPRRSCRAGA